MKSGILNDLDFDPQPLGMSEVTGEQDVNDAILQEAIKNNKIFLQHVQQEWDQKKRDEVYELEQDR